MFLALNITPCVAGSAGLPPPPLRETIFSSEIRSVEYEKPGLIADDKEQRETVLFDDIGKTVYVVGAVTL